MKLTIGLLAALAVTQVSCDLIGDLRRAAETYVDGIGELTQKLDELLSKDLKSNTVFSPMSLGSVLLTLLAASDGKTHEQIKRVLGFDKLDLNIDYHDELVHRVMGALQRRFSNSEIDFPQTNEATGVFVKNGFPINETFQRVIQKAYKSDVQNLDFLNNPEEAKNVINQWASDATRGKIPKMLETVNTQTEIVIASALYFNGAWETPFIEEITRRQKFHTEHDDPVEVDMMFSGGYFPYYHDENLRAHIIALPYKGTDQFNVSMYAIQPIGEKVGAKTLDLLKRKLKMSVVESLLEKMITQSCIIGFPKMQLSNNIDLQVSLTRLGLDSLFSPIDADFSHLTAKNQKTRLVVSDIAHNVAMTIDEKGTEAAATTSVMMNKSGHTRFIANRPFTFFIRDNRSKLILFWATINRPTPSY